MSEIPTHDEPRTETDSTVPNFVLTGPFDDGKIAVHRRGEERPLTPQFLVAAKLQYVLTGGQGTWEHSTGNTTRYDADRQIIVDIKAAVAAANERFPDGPANTDRVVRRKNRRVS